jgi:peptidoglycan/xylan/chitin deacetylase (PgdA/CDA1 family)
MYHDLVADDGTTTGFGGPGSARYDVAQKAFLAHLDRIAETLDGPPAVVDDVLAGRAGSRAWLLTFDDGGATALEAGEELASRGWRGHFFVTTDFIGGEGFVDAAAIRELSSMGHVIGSHSCSHPARMSALSSDDLLEEWEGSVSVLSDLLDEPIRAASVPGGYYSTAVARAAAKAGIEALFTSEPVRTPRPVGRCLVFGRLSIRSTTSPDVAAGAAAGQDNVWLRQYVGWTLRKPIKALIGSHYERARRVIVATTSQK